MRRPVVDFGQNVLLRLLIGNLLERPVGDYNDHVSGLGVKGN